MRDDDLRHWLRQRNPWWRSDPGNTEWINHDTTLRRAKGLGLDYHPAIMEGLLDGGLYVITAVPGWIAVIPAGLLALLLE